MKEITIIGSDIQEVARSVIAINFLTSHESKVGIMMEIAIIGYGIQEVIGSVIAINLRTSHK